jgi:hypothetical protein
VTLSSYSKAFVSAVIVGFLAVLAVAAPGQKDIGRGALVFGSEAIVSGLVVALCIKFSKVAWSWTMASSAVFGVFLLLAAAVPLLLFRR